MKTWIAFLRGINVGGHNILPMKELLSLMERIGSSDAKTYIQSGNCVFRSKEVDASLLADQLSTAVSKAKGFQPIVLVLPLHELDLILGRNPFNVDINEGSKVHFLFSKSGKLQFNAEEAAKLSAPGERVEVIGNVLYFHAPNGVGHSKLFASLPKLLNHDVTARNLRTVLKVQAMANAIQ